ncbi:hypothetical protein KAX02_03040 [candidate division WOR-3 bacterium]|nr:hypothetical protein [candidate division WOR-3 bacterium]
MNPGLINFESFDVPAEKGLINFEPFDKPEKVGRIDFENSGRIILPEIPKKAKKPQKILPSIKRVFSSELPKEDSRLYGIPKGASPSMSTITGRPAPTAKEEFAGSKSVMALIPHAFAAFTRGAIPEALETAIMQPVVKLITGHDYISPITEAKRVSGELLPKVARKVTGVPAQMAGIVVPLSVAFKTADAALKTIGLSAKAMKDTAIFNQLTYHIIRGGTAGGIYGGIAEGTVAGMAKDAALFAVLEGVLGTVAPVINKISKANWYRKLSIKERGLVTEKVAKQYREGMTEADVLRFLGKESETYKKAMATRGADIKTIPKIKPIKSKAVKPTITEPLKPTVKPTELGRKLQAAIKAEKRPPVIADLAKREIEIKKGKIDFEAPVKKDLITEATKQRQLEKKRAEIDFEKAIAAEKVEKAEVKPDIKKDFAKIVEIEERSPSQKHYFFGVRVVSADAAKEMKVGDILEPSAHSIDDKIIIEDIGGTAVFHDETDIKKAIDYAKKYDIGEESKIILVGSEDAPLSNLEAEMPEEGAVALKNPVVLAIKDNFYELPTVKPLPPKIEKPTKSVAITEEIEDKVIPEVKPKIEKAETQQKSDNVEFFSGLPIHKFPKAAKGLAKLYDDHVGLPIWNYVSETLPVKAGKRFELIDRINKGIILDYRKDPKFVEVRDDTLFKIQQGKEAAKELASAMAKFSRAEQIRIGQITEGSVTAVPKRYETAFEAIKRFQWAKKRLQELGILGEDNRFRQLSRKEIATKFKEIKTIDNKIKILQKKLKPIIKTSKIVRQVSDDISEEIIATTTDTTTGFYETKVTKFSELIKGRIKEALLQRGFAEGEATQMIARLKESVIPLEGKKGTLKEIKTTVKSVVTRTIIQEIEKLKTYSPSMMARARGSLVKDINKEIKKREEILERIRLHYTMSGKLYLRRAYEKFENEKGFLSKLMGYAFKRPRLIKGYDIRRKDLSYLYRKELGEIKKAPRLVYKGLSDAIHDIFMMEMFNKVAENKDWTISPQQLSVINSGKNEKLILKYKDFKPLPVTLKLGKLSGQLVDPYIWDDLNQAVIVTNDMIKAWDSVLRLWKTGKVVYNPATQCRNMLSNTILADFGGLPPHRIDIYAQAAKELLTKGQYWKETKQTPLLGTEWAGAEIKQFLTETSELKEGSFLAKSSKTIRSLLDKPGQAYQGTEQFFKLAVFINERKAGRTIKEAAAHAEKTIFNYMKIPPAIRWAKRWYSPFITFSYKALPRFAETVIRKPWKIAKYGIMMLAVEEITRRMYGESKEEVEQEKKVLPDYMRKTILPGQLSHLRIPYKDKYRQSKYLDLSFILPWGDIAEQWGQSHLVGRPFLPSHPLYIAVAEVAFNEILFTGQELTAKDIDEGSDYLKKIGIQMWRQAVPSLAGSYSYNKLMAAYKGEVDWALRDRSFPEAIFDVFFGLKVRSIDYTESRGKKLNYLKGRINKIKAQFEKDYTKIIYNPTLDLEYDQQRIAKLYIKMDKQIDKILEKITEIEE